MHKATLLSFFTMKIIANRKYAKSDQQGTSMVITTTSAGLEENTICNIFFSEDHFLNLFFNDGDDDDYCNFSFAHKRSIV